MKSYIHRNLQQLSIYIMLDKMCLLIQFIKVTTLKFNIYSNKKPKISMTTVKVLNTFFFKLLWRTIMVHQSVPKRLSLITTSKNVFFFFIWRRKLLENIEGQVKNKRKKTFLNVIIKPDCLDQYLNNRDWLVHHKSKS